MVDGVKLPDDMIHNTEIGKFKLEATRDLGIYINSCAYILMDRLEDGTFNLDNAIVKIRGIPGLTQDETRQYLIGRTHLLRA